MEPISKEMKTFIEDSQHALGRARTQISFKKVIQRIIRSLGYTHFDVTCYEDNLGLDILLSDVPESLGDTYFSEGYYKSDLAVEYMAEAETGVFSWDLYQHFSSSPVKTKRIAKTIEALELYRDYCLGSVYSCPSTDSNNKIILSLFLENSKKECEIKKKVMQERGKISFLSNIIQQEIFNSDVFVTKNTHQKAFSLTQREISILENLGQNSLTLKETASSIGVAESTVKKSCQEIKRKLGKPTLIGAYNEAIKIGHINTG